MTQSASSQHFRRDPTCQTCSKQVADIDSVNPPALQGGCCYNFPWRGIPREGGDCRTHNQQGACGQSSSGGWGAGPGPGDTFSDLRAPGCEGGVAAGTGVLGAAEVPGPAVPPPPRLLAGRGPLMTTWGRERGRLPIPWTREGPHSAPWRPVVVPWCEQHPRRYLEDARRTE